MNIKIEDFELLPLSQTNFIKPYLLSYKLNGKKRKWEAVKSFDSVSILLYHKEFDSFLFVKQFRAPVYLNSDKKHLFTYELCAGIVDKEKSLVQIAKEEVNEECGYDINIQDIQKITSLYTNSGVSGAKQTMFFACIDESMKVHEGGGIADEEIEVCFVDKKDVKKFIFDESSAKSAGLMLAIFWFFENKE